MIRFLADEHIPFAIVDALRTHYPKVDVITAREAGLAGMKDPDVLAWADSDRRVLLTYDVNTMISHAKDRLQRGHHIAGVMLLSSRAPVKELAFDLALVAETSEPADYVDRVAFGPFG